MKKFEVTSEDNSSSVLGLLPNHWLLKNRVLFCRLPKGVLIGSVGKMLIFPEELGPP